MFCQRSVAVATVVLLLQLSICRLTTAQLPFPQQCPEVKVPDEFNVDAYMGVWYEYSKYPFVFEIGKKCIQGKYSKTGNNTIAVLNSSINQITGSSSSTSGSGKVLAPGKLAVTFGKNSRSVIESLNSPNYLVLGTDYQTYAVVYSCKNMTAFAHTKKLWILTRERKPTPETLQAAKKIVDDNQLPQSFLIDTIQDGCPGDEPTTAKVIDLAAQSTETSNVIDKA